DAVVLGEGEKIGHRLVAAWAGNLKFEEVSGIAYMENGKMRINPRQASDTPQPSDFVFPAFYPPLLKEYNESSEGVTPDWVRKEGYMMSIETSRGCNTCPPCPFCTTPMLRGRYRAMPLEQEVKLLKHYKKYGVKTLLEWEDNRLARLNLLNGREEVLAAFQARREMGFLWEFSNGLEIGKFVKEDGSIDKELIRTLYNFDFEKMRGCFRAYTPLESVRHDGSEPLYRKLKPWEIEKEILREIVRTGVPVLTIGLIIGIPSETKETLELTYKRCDEIKRLVEEENKRKEGTGKAETYAVFTLFLDIPLPGSPDYMEFSREGRIKYSIEEHPELWNFYTSVLNGDVFPPEEMTKIREEMARKLNGEEAMELWEKRGRYPYPSEKPLTEGPM
ncbi:MAG: radical SAM protein, partial [Candidatus Micrarchaeota archaeon]